VIKAFASRHADVEMQKPAAAEDGTTSEGVLWKYMSGPLRGPDVSHR